MQQYIPCNLTDIYFIAAVDNQANVTSKSNTKRTASNEFVHGSPITIKDVPRDEDLHTGKMYYFVSNLPMKH